MSIQKILVELVSKGFTQHEISRKTGVPQPNISRVITGKTSNMIYDNGKAIEIFYMEVMRNQKAS